MADLAERVSKLEAQRDDHAQTHERDDEDRKELLFRIDAAISSLAGIRPAIENVTQKVDGINDRLDTLNGSVQAIKLLKADKTELEKLNTTQVKTDKTVVEIKTNYKWMYLIGGFITLLLLAHLGMTLYAPSPHVSKPAPAVELHGSK